MFQKIKEWWMQPSAKDRILDAMSPIEWRRSLDIMKAARVSIASFYGRIFRLEDEGIIESKWEEGPTDPCRRGYRRRLYRLTQQGSKVRLKSRSKAEAMREIPGIHQPA